MKMDWDTDQILSDLDIATIIFVLNKNLYVGKADIPSRITWPSIKLE